MFGVARRDLYKLEILHAKMNHERAIARGKRRKRREGEGGCIGTRDRARLTFILRQGVLQLRRREEGQRRLRTSNHGKLNSVAPSVRPTQPLTRSPMRWPPAVVVLRLGVGEGDSGDGFRVNGITRVTGWPTARGG